MRGEINPGKLQEPETLALPLPLLFQMWLGDKNGLVFYLLWAFSPTNSDVLYY